MGFNDLELANGPPCPHCGCRDVRITKEPSSEASWWGDGRAICGHCRKQFAFRKLPGELIPAVDHEEVETYQLPARDSAYPVRECPECGSPNVLVKSSPKPKPGRPKIRYHECRDCPAKFKSIDRRHLKPALRVVS